MIELLVPRLRVRRREREVVLDAELPLGPIERCVGDWLVRWAAARPTTTFLAERDATGGWTTLCYGEALGRVERLASALVALGLERRRPIMILSDNSIAAALVQLAAMHLGVPVAPVSSAYSLMSTSFARLRAVAEQLVPGAIFVEDRGRFAGALGALGELGRDAVVLTAESAARAGEVAAGAGLPTWSRAAHALEELERAPRSAAVGRAFAAVGPDTVAKILFTSGSTGWPRGVVNTQRMLCANQQGLAMCWPFLASRPPRIVDWLPWSHTFGGNHNFFLVLRAGGSLYLDRGRPAPGLIDVTLGNLAEVAPTLWFNVPRGFDVAVPLLEADPALAAAVFRELDMVFYAAAALSPSTRARLEAVAARAGRPDVFFTSSWGSTETSPLSTSAHFPTREVGILGVPIPGVSLKLAPVDDQLELRVRGPNVTPGVWRPGGELEPVVLDDEGFLPIGDAGALVDEARPEAGVRFVGRLSENFKLSSGTWVSVGKVRLAVVDACAPLVQDAVIAGHDRAELGVLLFLTPAARARLTAPPDAVEAAATPAGAVVELRAALTAKLAAYDATHAASSERIARALIAVEPLSLDDGETTDKGYTNQRRVLSRRADEIARLFAEPPDPDVISLR